MIHWNENLIIQRLFKGILFLIVFLQLIFVPNILANAQSTEDFPCNSKFGCPKATETAFTEVEEGVFEEKIEPSTNLTLLIPIIFVVISLGIYFSFRLRKHHNSVPVIEEESSSQAPEV